VTPSVVCLHGLRRTPSDWDGVRAGLARHGTVRTPRLPPRPAEALACADAAIAAGDIVIGHSMGGVLALRLAQTRPRPLRALILTGCFFPPARNRRALTTAIADYAAHRLAFARDAIRGRGDGLPSDGSARALGSLIRQIATPRSSEAMFSSVAGPVLVVHARDDHHVPVDYALAAACGRPGWTVRILDHGGHHAHLRCPRLWLDAVTPWLTAAAGQRRVPGR
jgi:pimeloyl-ACP methyl ester carboxylesterase